MPSIYYELLHSIESQKTNVLYPKPHQDKQENSLFPISTCKQILSCRDVFINFWVVKGRHYPCKNVIQHKQEIFLDNL